MGAVTEMLSPELTVAWSLLAVWGLLQLAWYRRVRVAPAPPPPRRTDSSARIASARRAVPALPTGGSAEFLAELGLTEPERAGVRRSVTSPVDETRSVYR